MKAASFLGEPTFLSPHSLSALKGAVAWWLGELSRLAPKSLARGERVWLVRRDGTLLLERQRRRGFETLASATLDEIDARKGRALRRKARRLAAKGAEFWFAVENARLLRRRVVMPRAAAAHLRQALSLQLVEDSPFDIDDIAFDHRVLGEERDGEALQVEQVIISAPQLSEITELAAAAGVRLNGVAPSEDRRGREAGARLNLLPESQRPRLSLWPARLNLALLGLLLLCAAGLAISIAERTERIAQARETQLAALKIEAEKTFAEQARLGRMQDELRASQRIAEGRMRLLALMEQLAERLPDDAWLVELRLADGGCTIFGYAKSAAKLLLALQSAPYVEEARFSSPTTFDARAGAEKFYIALTLSTLPDRETATTEASGRESEGRL